MTAIHGIVLVDREALPYPGEIAAVLARLGPEAEGELVTAEILVPGATAAELDALAPIARTSDLPRCLTAIGLWDLAAPDARGSLRLLYDHLVQRVADVEEGVELALSGRTLSPSTPIDDAWAPAPSAIVVDLTFASPQAMVLASLLRTGRHSSGRLSLTTDAGTVEDALVLGGALIALEHAISTAERSGDLRLITDALRNEAVLEPLAAAHLVRALADLCAKLEELQGALEFHLVPSVAPAAASVIEHLDALRLELMTVPLLRRPLDGLRAVVEPLAVEVEGLAALRHPKLVGALARFWIDTGHAGPALLLGSEALQSGYLAVQHATWPQRFPASMPVTSPSLTRKLRRNAAAGLRKETRARGIAIQIGELWSRTRGRNSVAHCGASSPPSARELREACKRIFGGGNGDGESPLVLRLTDVAALRGVAEPESAPWQAILKVFVSDSVPSQRLVALVEAAERFMKCEGGKLAEVECRIIPRPLSPDGARATVDTAAPLFARNEKHEGASCFWLVDGDAVDIALFTALGASAEIEDLLLAESATDARGGLALRRWSEIEEALDRKETS